MSSAGGGDEGRGGGISCENLFSGMNGGGGILLGGGGARGGGGNTIMGGRDLSITLGTVEGVRERETISSITDDKVDSMDCRRSE